MEAVKGRDDSPDKYAGANDRDLIPHLSEPIKIDVFNTLVSEVLEQGAIVRDRGVLCLPNRLPERSVADQTLWLELIALLETVGYRAPVVHDLTDSLSIELTCPSN